MSPVPGDLLAVAVRALEQASSAVHTLMDMGEAIVLTLPSSTDEDPARAVLQGHHAVALQACNALHEALARLGERSAEGDVS